MQAEAQVMAATTAEGSEAQEAVPDPGPRRCKRTRKAAASDDDDAVLSSTDVPANEMPQAA